MTGEAVDPAAKLKLIKAEEEAIAREKEEEEQALLHQQRDKAEQLLREKAERELELSLVSGRSSLIYSHERIPSFIKSFTSCTVLLVKYKSIWYKFPGNTQML